jgi:hypothetical protein
MASILALKSAIEAWNPRLRACKIYYAFRVVKTLEWLLLVNG